MSETKQLEAPDGSVTLQGPGEHPGESRYSRLIPARGPSPPSLAIRIDKTASGWKEDDRISPVTSFSFVSNGQLWIRPEKSLNPYLNTIVTSSPRIVVPKGALRPGRYRISARTGFWGDFVILTGEPRRKWTYCLILNLSALGLLDGLSEVFLNGQFVLYDREIGKLKPSGGSIGPFFLSRDIPNGEEHHVFQAFASESYISALKLVVPTSPSGIGVQKFLGIDMSRFAHRGSISSEKAHELGRTAFKELFPQ